MNRIVRDERGMALAVAVFALVFVGAMAAGAFFVGTQEQRVSENQHRVLASLGVAEAGAQERVFTWVPDSMNLRNQYPRDSVVIGPNTPAPNGTGSYGGYSYKVGPNIFLIDVTGRDGASAAAAIAGGGGARQRIGLITRIAPIDFGIMASLTTQGTVAVNGNAMINGADQVPTGWNSCAPPGPAQAGVRDAGGTVTWQGSSVTGNPAVVNDPTINNNTFTVFGGATYAQLAARANIILPGGNYNNSIQPVVTNGVCDKTILSNWGDGQNPGTPCSTYFPIIHVTGDIDVNGVQGQGILLVDGTLRVNGSFDFFGIVIIQGDLNMGGGGNGDAHFWGGVMSRSATLSSQITGHATLNYSSCAILTALQASSPISMMRSRGWVQLY